MRTVRIVLLLSLVCVLAASGPAFAVGAAGEAGPSRETAGPAAAGGTTDRGGTPSGDADQLRTRDELRDGTCEVVEDPTAEALADAAAASEPAQTRSRTAVITQTRTTTATQLRLRTSSGDGSCDTSETRDGVPDQIRDRKMLKDGSCDDTGTVVAVTAQAVEPTADSGDQVRDRISLLDRVVESVPQGVAEWLRAMLRTFGLVA